MSKNTKDIDQRERFERTARELGVELDEEKLKVALRRIVPSDHAKRDEASDETSQS